MAIPTYGAAPVAKTFLVIRFLQVACFAGIIGMTANFVAELVSAGISPPSEILGTLTVTSTAALYALISIPFFWAQANLGLMIMCTMDFLLLVAFIIVSVILGKPLSYLNCFIMPSSSSSTSSALGFSQSLASSILHNKGAARFLNYVGESRASCFEAKSIWGLSMALSILFFCSVFILPALFAKQKRAAGNKGKNVVF